MTVKFNLWCGVRKLPVMQLIGKLFVAIMPHSLMLATHHSIICCKNSTENFLIFKYVKVNFLPNTHHVLLGFLVLKCTFLRVRAWWVLYGSNYKVNWLPRHLLLFGVKKSIKKVFTAAFVIEMRENLLGSN